MCLLACADPVVKPVNIHGRIYSVLGSCSVVTHSNFENFRKI